ncbi:membrane insertase [Perilla frutescens var. frutescens]|nr:membrane insertase [Perilla frutescens var. frutescens]
MSQSEPSRLRRGSPSPLYKQNSWSPDILRDEAWINRRKNNRLRRSRSFTDDDLDELRACFELGFNFDSPDLDPKLSSTFPALELYRAVNRNYSNSLSRSSSASFSDSDSAASTVGSSDFIVSPGDDPDLVKTRLRQWAQVVACSVRQTSPICCDSDRCSGKKGSEEREKSTLHI